MARVHRFPVRYIVATLVLASGVALPRHSTAVEWLPGGTPFESHAGSVTDLVALPDGAGGLFLAWVQGNGDSLFAQRVDADGNRLWGTNGVTVCGATGSQTALRIAADGAGGIVLVWTDTRTDPQPDVYVQRVAGNGSILWTVDGVALTSAGSLSAPDIVGDGLGGAIAAWVLNSTDIAVRSIDSSGVPEGPANGTTVCAATGNQTVPRIISDGAAGAIVTWQDARVSGPDIYAARFTSAGAVPWTPDGAAVVVAQGNQTLPEIATDGAGGAIVVLHYQTTFPFSLPVVLAAQRIDGSGAQLWGVNGVAVTGLVPGSHRIVADGAGGIFAQFPSGGGAYLQRLDMNGAAQWTSNGLSLGTGTPLNLIPDGAGGLLVCWSGGSPARIRVQAFSGAGAPQWGANGATLGSVSGSRFHIAPDGAGGVMLAWDDALADDVYGLRVLAGGAVTFLHPSLDVADLPADEGGWVRLLVDLNTADPYPTEPEETGFVVWRRIAPPADAAATPPARGFDVADAIARARSESVRLSPALAAAAGFPPGTWETLGFHASLQIRNYAVAAPTRADSTAAGNADEVFVVVTHTTTPTVWYVSQPDSGHSVDNLAPDAPQSLAGTFEPSSALHLTWAPNAEGDLHRYAIYRGPNAGFIPGSANRLGYATTAAFDDPAFSAGSYYKVSAIDRHGNESPHALLTPQQVTGVAGGSVPSISFLAPPAPSPASVSCAFEFGLSRDGRVRLELFDLAGRRLRALRDGNETAGVHRAAWDLRDGRGRRVGPGIYWARFSAEGRTIARRFTVCD